MTNMKAAYCFKSFQWSLHHFVE